MSVERAINNMNAADHTWRAALRQHRLAPPDDGFSRRLKDFADACVVLLRDKAASERLGRAARDVAGALYSRAAAVTLASRIISEAMAAGATKPLR